MRPRDVIGIQVHAADPGLCAPAVHIAAGHGSADGVVVLDRRQRVPAGIVGPGGLGRVGVRALTDVPAVVAAARRRGLDVDLFPRVLTHVGEVEFPVPRSNEKRQGLRSPSAQISGWNAVSATNGLSGGMRYRSDVPMAPVTSMRSSLPRSDFPFWALRFGSPPLPPSPIPM